MQLIGGKKDLEVFVNGGQKMQWMAFLDHNVC